ncbi:MAG TPA: hypothetical protein VFG89_10320 [Coriobacteriia bacterium]|nr:hypothetical protein [Coriobacteriia bacterium]
MKKWIIAALVVAVLAGTAIWYRATALTIVTKEIPMAGVESVQCGGDVTLIQDGQDKLVIRTTRRALPWALARKEGTFLQLGWPDDADPRGLLVGFNTAILGDKLEFELHSSTARDINVGVDTSFHAKSITGDTFKFHFSGREPMTLQGIDVGTLTIETDGDSAKLTLIGRTGELTGLNSGGVTLDASKLEVGSSTIIGGGTTIQNPK